MYCLINFLIFYYRLIFCKNKILLLSDIKFAEILVKLFEECNRDMERYADLIEKSLYDDLGDYDDDDD